MKYLFMAALVAAAFAATSARAQVTTPGAPGMGRTSPLGIIGQTAPAGPTGIPLGATELDPGGLSPAPASSTNCTSDGLSPAVTTGTFDGGGATSTTTATACSTTGTGFNGAPTMSTGSGATSVVGGSIPLGATELGGPGISPMLTVPAPAMTATSMPALNAPTTPSPGVAPCLSSGATMLGSGSSGSQTDILGNPVGASSC